MSENHKELLFVYGSLLTGMGNHALLDNVESTLVSEHTTEPEFTLRDLGYYPGVHLDGETAIKGELWSVSEAVWERVEHLEGYPSFYDRTPLETPHGAALMYFLPEDYADTQPEVDSGDWKGYYHARGRGY